MWGTNYFFIATFRTCTVLVKAFYQILIVHQVPTPLEGALMPFSSFLIVTFVVLYAQNFKPYSELTDVVKKYNTLQIILKGVVHVIFFNI